jgi:hypothetical protein
VRRTTNPATITGTLRKTGVALAVAPEPLTTVAGAALLGVSFVARSKEPATLKTLREEKVVALTNIESLRSDLTLPLH